MPPVVDRLAVDGMVSEPVKDYYAARARGGVGLIVLTPGIVDITMASPIQLGLYEDRFIAGLRELTEIVHANGALIGIQLMHLGRQGEGIVGYSQWQLLLFPGRRMRKCPESCLEMRSRI